MSANTGGPAFPSAQLDTTTLTYKYVEGMTLRDYFAAKALESILYMDRGSGIIGVNNHEHYCAKDAYRVADAMLKAREA
jgi:hypothetical protein